MTALAVLDFFRETETNPLEGLKMATMVTGAQLRKAVQTGELIKDGIPDSVEGVKYDFHLSPSRCGRTAQPKAQAKPCRNSHAWRTLYRPWI